MTDRQFLADLDKRIEAHRRWLAEYDRRVAALDRRIDQPLFSRTERAA
jgi:hypothetical protein